MVRQRRGRDPMLGRCRFCSAPGVAWRGAAGAAPMRSRRRSGSGTTQTHLSPRFSPDLVTKAPIVRQIGPHVAKSDEA